MKTIIQNFRNFNPNLLTLRIVFSLFVVICCVMAAYVIYRTHQKYDELIQLTLTLAQDLKDLRTALGKSNELIITLTNEVEGLNWELKQKDLLIQEMIQTEAVISLPSEVAPVWITWTTAGYTILGLAASFGVYCLLRNASLFYVFRAPFASVAALIPSNMRGPEYFYGVLPPGGSDFLIEMEGDAVAGVLVRVHASLARIPVGDFVAPAGLNILPANDAAMQAARDFLLASIY